MSLLPSCLHACRFPSHSNLLQHSTTALFYLLPPHGPLPKADLLMMAALSKHVALLPLIVMPDEASCFTEEAAAYRASVAAMLADVQLPGLQLGPAKVFDK